nr:lysylphosphatidylglycerol synthase domain-containing protein [Salsipaludibacter albus]
MTVAGLAWMAWALRDGWQDLSLSALPSPPALVFLLVLVGVSMLCAYTAWMTLLRERHTRRSLRNFMVAQVAKYVPGGIWQGVGQVTGHARDSGRSVTATSVAYLLQALTQLASTSVFAMALIVSGTPATVLEWAATIGISATALLLYRPGMAWAWSMIRRWRSSIPDDAGIPPQRVILRAAGLGVAAIGLQGWAFAGFLGGSGVPEDLSVVAVYAVAWAVGFAALPLPAGLGVRELLLVAMLPGVGTAQVVAASVALRVAQIVVEVVVVGVAVAWDRRRP